MLFLIYIDFIKDKKELLKEEEKEYIKLIKKILIYFRKIFNYITIIIRWKTWINVKNVNSTVDILPFFRVDEKVE